MSTVIENGLLMGSYEDTHYNSRTKYFVNPDGELVPYELMVCSRQIFAESGSELSDFSREVARELAYREAAEEVFNGHGFGSGYVPEPKTREELLDASRRRAKRKVFDYIMCNDFDLFITLTLNPDKVNRNDYGAVIKLLSTYLANRVRRNGLRYVGVPELHKRGGLHFHFAANSSAFRLVDSGTVSCTGRKRPIKVSTADRLGIPLSDRHTVYNLPDWQLGYSTAIKAYGERGAVAHYLCKELLKPQQKTVNGVYDKIGGRWYLHGGKLAAPVIKLSNNNFKEMEGFTYACATDGGDFRVYCFDSNGGILS